MKCKLERFCSGDESREKISAWAMSIIDDDSIRITLGQYMTEHGATAEQITAAQADLARGLGTGAPQPATEFVKAWGKFMITAASLGSGTVVGGSSMAVGGLIGGSANAGVQLQGDKPFSYTDLFIATGFAALTQGKGVVATEGYRCERSLCR